jgi:hypothetical protein
MKYQVMLRRQPEAESLFTIEVFAKSEEQARHRARRKMAAAKASSPTALIKDYSWEIVSVQLIDSNPEIGPTKRRLIYPAATVALALGLLVLGDVSGLRWMGWIIFAIVGLGGVAGLFYLSAHPRLWFLGGEFVRRIWWLLAVTWVFLAWVLLSLVGLVNA